MRVYLDLLIANPGIVKEFAAKVDDIRIICEIRGSELIIDIITIGYRREMYLNK